MRIAMIGTGYVGLVVGLFCRVRRRSGGGNDGGKIEALRGGQIPIYEPGLEDLVKRNAESGRLTFTRDLPSAVRAADAVFIAVGTPSRRGDGHADLTYLFAARRRSRAA